MILGLSPGLQNAESRMPSLHRLPDLLRSRGHAPDEHADGIVNRIGDGRVDGYRRAMADPLAPNGPDGTGSSWKTTSISGTSKVDGIL